MTETEDLLRDMPDATAFMWSLDGIDPGDNVKSWMARRAEVLSHLKEGPFTFRILPVTPASLLEEMNQDYNVMAYRAKRIRWLYEEFERLRGRDEGRG